MSIQEQYEARSFLPPTHGPAAPRDIPTKGRAERAAIDHAVTQHVLESAPEQPRTLVAPFEAAREKLIATPAMSDPLTIAYKLKQIAGGMELGARRFDDRMARLWVADPDKSPEQRYLASAYLDLVTLGALLAKSDEGRHD